MPWVLSRQHATRLGGDCGSHARADDAANGRGDAGTIDLTWGTGCTTGTTGYAVYQGTLGGIGSHALFAGACGITATSLTAQTPCAGNCYYLISGLDDVEGEEGSLGKTRPSAERPVSRVRGHDDLQLRAASPQAVDARRS